MEQDTAAPCVGDLDVSTQERAVKVRALFDLMVSAPEPIGPAIAEMLQRTSTHDGGQLAHLLTTAGGSV